MQTFKNRLRTYLPGALIFLGLFYVYWFFLSVIYGIENVDLGYLCRWDCGWYQAIVRNGYVSSVPPLSQQPDQSNVAFFPLFPGIAWLLGSLFGLPTEKAVPLVAILFSAGTFGLLSVLLRDKEGRFNWQRGALIAAYPATFYLYVGYSESVYCFFLFAGLLALRSRTRMGYVISFFSGLAMGLTRLTGFVIAGATAGIGKLVWLYSRSGKRKEPFPLRATVWFLGGVIGAGSFFAFAYFKFGAWNLYFQTLDIGWHKETSFSGFFSLFFRAVQKNFLPFWFAKDPLRMSWMINADVMLLYLFAIYREAGFIRNENRQELVHSRTLGERTLRISLLMGGLVHVFITTLGDSGDWHRWTNGMRYTMPAFFLLVILWDHRWNPHWLESRPNLKKGFWIFLLANWLPYQLYYLWLFSKQEWVS